MIWSMNRIIQLSLGWIGWLPCIVIKASPDLKWQLFSGCLLNQQKCGAIGLAHSVLDLFSANDNMINKFCKNIFLYI